MHTFFCKTVLHCSWGHNKRSVSEQSLLEMKGLLQKHLLITHGFTVLMTWVHQHVDSVTKVQLSEQTLETKLFLFPKYVPECLFSVDCVPSAVTPGVMRTVLETCEDFIHYYKEYLKYFMGNGRHILAVNS